MCGDCAFNRVKNSYMKNFAVDLARITPPELSKGILSLKNRTDKLPRSLLEKSEEERRLAEKQKHSLHSVGSTKDLCATSVTLMK